MGGEWLWGESRGCRLLVGWGDRRGSLKGFAGRRLDREVVSYNVD